MQESRLLLKERAKEKKLDAEQLSKEAGIDLDVIELPAMLRFDAPRIWIRFRRAAPELCAVACAFLTIAPTEPAVERSFSDQGNIHSKKKNRFKIEHVRNEMHIRFNGRALDKRSEQGDFVEMNLNDEYEPVQFTMSRPIHKDSGSTSSSSDRSSESEAAPDDDSNLNEYDGNDSGRDDENLNSGAESDYDSRQQMVLESENDMQISDFVPPPPMHRSAKVNRFQQNRYRKNRAI